MPQTSTKKIEKNRSQPSILKQGIIIFLSVILIRLSLAWIFGIEVADIDQFHTMANLIANNKNIFDTEGLFHYTPIAMFLPYWCLRIGEFFKLPFHFVIKWPAILSDAGIALLIWHYFLTHAKMSKNAFEAGLVYAFNPVSLLITCFHGSYNIVYIFFVVIAFVLMSSDNDNRFYRLSALCMGVAIGFRGFAVLFIPFFLKKMQLSWRKKIVFVFLAGIPSVITLIPAVIANFQAVWRDTFSYSGVTDYGWIAISRAYWFLVSGNIYLPGTMGNDFLSLSKWIFLFSYAAFVIYFFFLEHELTLLDGILVTILLFYVVYGGISSQYLAWIIPFAVLYGMKWLQRYSVSAAIALICFYLFYFPKILFGSLPIAWRELNSEVTIFVLLGNVVFWVICSVWMARIIIPRKYWKIRKPHIPLLESAKKIIE